LVLLGLGGCGDYWQFAHDERVDGPYRLQAVDTLSEMSVNYACHGGAAERIQETVFKVGFDERFLVAARHPFDDVSGRFDEKVTEYYYLVRSADGCDKLSSVSVHGPFDAARFDQESRRLDLPHFSRIITDWR